MSKRYIEVNEEAEQMVKLSECLPETPGNAIIACINVLNETDHLTLPDDDTNVWKCCGCRE